LFFLFSLPLYSQNMIDNGGFETSPLDHLLQEKASTKELENWGDFGYQWVHLNNYCGGKAFDGVCYIDLRLYSHKVKNYREYAEAKITCPLIEGARYIVRFRTMPIKGRYLIGNIGGYLSKVPLDISTHELLPYTATIVSARDSLVNNTKDYTLVEDTITAKGGEQYLIIGNFNTDRKTLKCVSGYDTIYKYYSAIYAFDDVEIIPLNPIECPGAEKKPSSNSEQAIVAVHLDTSFVLNNIHFGFDSIEPTGEFDDQLDLIKYLLNGDASLVVKISGYADLTGKDDYNVALSFKRAEAISKRLTIIGVDSHRICVAGYGNKFPVENTIGKSPANRRVEINIMSLAELNFDHLSCTCQKKAE